MPSPFPGMDPYLEEENVWPMLQHHLVLSLYQLLLPGLVDRYRARVGQRCYATEQALFTSVVRQEHQEDFIEIRHRSDGQIVSLIDLVSPINRTTPEGREAYMATRKEAKRVGSNLVEIDLVLQGEPMLDYSRDNLPDWDFAVTVTRATHPERHEIYTSMLEKRLPRFRLPLASDDRDTVMDLQSAFNRAYEQAGLMEQLDYTKPPKTTLSDAQREWLQSLLRDAGLR